MNVRAMNTATNTATVRPTHTHLSPAVLLLATGVVLLLSAATVFVTREWDRLGVGGQALVLALVTIIAGTAALLSWRRRLTATTEALAAVTTGLLVLDLLGARSRGLLGLDAVPVAGYIAAAGLVVAVLGTAVVAATAAHGRRILTALAAACLAVPVAAAAVVVEIARYSQQLSPVAVLPERLAAGWVEGLLVLGLAMRVAWLIRDVAGLRPLVVLTRWVACSALCGAGLTAVVAAAIGVGRSDLYPATTAVPAGLVIRTIALGTIGLVLGGWRCKVPRPAAQSGAAAAGWSLLALGALAGLVSMAAPLELVVVGPVLALAVAARLPRRAGAARLAVTAAWVCFVTGVLAAAVLIGACAVRLAVLTTATAEVGARPDVWHARLVLTLLVAAGFGVMVPAGRARGSSAARAAWHGVLTLAGTATPAAVWSIVTPGPGVMAAGSVGVAALVAVAAGVAWRVRRRWWAPTATAATVAAWWLTGLVIAASSGSMGGFVTVTGLGVLAFAAAVTPAWPARTASDDTAPGGTASSHTASGGTASSDTARGGTASDIAACLGLSAVTTGVGLLVGQWIGGAGAALGVSVLAALALLLVPAWQLARVAAAALGAVAVLALVVHAPDSAPLGWGAAAAAGLVAQAIAGTRDVAGGYPVRPHAARHIAVPGSVATLAVELIDLAVPRLATVPVDAGALRAAAVLAATAGYVWLQLRDTRRSAGRPPLTGTARVVLRDLVLPVVLAALAAAVMMAITPALSPLPLTTTLMPLLVVLLAVLVNARLVLRRDDPSQPVPLRWVRDVVLRLSETVALLVALAVLRPVTGLPIEVELATVTVLTLGAHAVRTARDRRAARLSATVQLTDVVTLLSALTLGMISPIVGASPLWVSGLTWLCDGLWALFIAVALSGPLAGQWPGRAVGRGWLAIRIGAAMAFLGYLMLLTLAGGPPIEAVSVPLGVLLAGFGCWAMTNGPVGFDVQDRPVLLGSLRCVLPGLLIVIGPSTWLAVTRPEDGLRPALTAAVAALLAVTGMLLRWRAPLLVGVVSAVSIAVVQALPIVSGLAQWVWLSAAGALTLGVGATYEEQVRRVRAVGGHWNLLR